MDASERSPVQTDDMRLDTTEFWAMNIPLRRWIQKYIEFRIFKEMLSRYSINLDGKAILDAGCGSGYSTELIINEFKPSRITAFDYMPEQISIARNRDLNVDFFVGDLTGIDSPDDIFDAVFVFGVLHHIPAWKTALSEVSRVLRPDGVLLVDEPRARFNWKEFESGIKDSGMTILDVRKFFLTYFHAYLCRKK